MTLSMTPDDVLALLKEGNRRFLSDEPMTVQGSRMSRLRMAAAQHPIAAWKGSEFSAYQSSMHYRAGACSVLHLVASLCSTIFSHEI